MIRKVMIMKKIILSLLIILLLIATSGCTYQSPIEYDLTGTIHEINQQSNNQGVIGTILVENEETKIYLTITNDTMITANGEEVEFEKFSLNQTVEVKIDGPVAESWPLQGTAGAINILD